MPEDVIKRCFNCGAPATHRCSECAECKADESDIEAPGYYCERHAERHNQIVRGSSGAVFAVPIPGKSEVSNG